MCRAILLILTCLLLATPGHTQMFDPSYDPYREALRRIEVTRVNGATELVVEGLELTELPPELWALSTLQILDISHNQLTVLPPEIGALRNLHTLDARNNQLTALPPEIGNLSALTRLRVGNNQLTALPQEIENLSALTSLDIAHNQLVILPPMLGRLPHLRYMAAWDNPLIYPPQSTLGQGPDAPLFYLRRVPVPPAYPPYCPGTGLAWVVGTWALVLWVVLRGIRGYVRRLG
jgi:hypothetical protein